MGLIATKIDFCKFPCIFSAITTSKMKLALETEYQSTTIPVFRVSDQANA